LNFLYKDFWFFENEMVPRLSERVFFNTQYYPGAKGIGWLLRRYDIMLSCLVFHDGGYGANRNYLKRGGGLRPLEKIRKSGLCTGQVA